MECTSFDEIAVHLILGCNFPCFLNGTRRRPDFALFDNALTTPPISCFFLNKLMKCFTLMLVKVFSVIISTRKSNSRERG